MIKRLMIIAFFNGSAYVLVLVVLKYISPLISSTKLKSLGELDSLTNFLISFIAFGLLASSVRDIALEKDWQKILVDSQKARTSLGLLLIPFSLIFFLNTNYIIFLFAPVFALNADYVLYGRSLPIMASIIVFIRTSVPYLAVIVTRSYFPEQILLSFILSTVIIYIVTGFYISRFLSLPYFFKPSFKSLLKYLKSINLGLVSISYYFIGLGLIPIAAFFYSDSTLALSYLGIKFYTIFKGVLRMINQSFMREMTDDIVCAKVDQLGFVSSALFLVITISFPASFTMLILGNEYLVAQKTLILLALAGLITACFNSLSTKALLMRKDNAYSFWAICAILCSCLSVVIFSFFSTSIHSIYTSLILGELILTIGLLKIVGNRNGLIERVKSFIIFLPLLLIPFIFRFAAGDQLYPLLGSILTCSIIFLVVYAKKFNLNANNALK